MEINSQSWKILIDGASRGNPGQAGAGICILRNNEFILKKGFYLGKKTNNQAEYLALALALFLFNKLLKREGITTTTITIISDSELMIRQMKGIYQVKNPELTLLKNAIDQMRQEFKCHFEHVLREYNQEADALANYGINNKKNVSPEFKKQMELLGVKF